MAQKDRQLASITVLLILIIIALFAFWLYLRGARIVSPEEPVITPSSVAVVSRSYNNDIDRWLPDMRRWEAAYGVPVNVQRALMIQESGGQQEARAVANSARGIFAKGLFQVVDDYDRFEPWEDPFDPDTNARVGLSILIGCNRIANGRSTGMTNTNWEDARVLYDTFWCYHDGQGHYENGYISPAGQIHARNVLALSGYALGSQSGQNISVRRPSGSAPSSMPEPMAIGQIDNMCYIDPNKNCKTGTDWVHGWCHYQALHDTDLIYPNSTPMECVTGLGHKYRTDWGG